MFENYYSVPSYVKKNAEEIMKKFNIEKLFKSDDIFYDGNFSKFTCHNKMIFAFQVFPLVFQKNLSDVRLRCFAYILCILDTLYGMDRDLDEVERLVGLLWLLFAIIEGITLLSICQ